MYFITNAFAEDVANVTENGTSPILSLVPLLLIFCVFYLMIIRPQHKKIKEHKSMIDSVKKGDKIVTSGGIIGEITKIEDEHVMLKIADGVEVKCAKTYIAESAEKEKK